jgi:hypothetical protein
LVHWGASSGGGLGGGTYYPPDITDTLGGVSEQLTAWGAFISVVVPLITACLGLLAPEMIRRSWAMRIGFVAFGASILALSILLVISMTLAIAFPGLVLVWEAGAMVFDGLRRSKFKTDTLVEEANGGT